MMITDILWPHVPSKDASSLSQHRPSFFLFYLDIFLFSLLVLVLNLYYLVPDHSFMLSQLRLPVTTQLSSLGKLRPTGKNSLKFWIYSYQEQSDLFLPNSPPNPSFFCDVFQYMLTGLVAYFEEVSSAYGRTRQHVLLTSMSPVQSVMSCRPSV